MVARTVNIALASYIDPDGISRFGLKGQEVEVADDFVDRFDDLNGPQAKSEDATPRKGRRRPAKDAGGDDA